MIDKYIYIEIRRTKFFSQAVKSLEMLVFFITISFWAVGLSWKDGSI